MPLCRLFSPESSRTPKRVLRSRSARVTEGAQTEAQRCWDGSRHGRLTPHGGRVSGSPDPRYVRYDNLQLGANTCQDPTARRRAVLRSPLRHGLRVPQWCRVLLRRSRIPLLAQSLARPPCGIAARALPLRRLGLTAALPWTPSPRRDRNIAMSKVVAIMSMSLDGYIADPMTSKAWPR